MRYNLTPKGEEPGYVEELQPQKMPEGPGWVSAAAARRPVKRKGPDIGEVAHYVFTLAMLGVGSFMLLAGVYLVWQGEDKGEVFLGAGLGLVTVALVLRGIERCARALEKLAGE